jgi:endonuclease/exonuclease/phosphatase family metal-dependent hydrolase
MKRINDRGNRTLNTNDKTSRDEVLSSDADKPRRVRKWLFVSVLVLAVILGPYFVSRYRAPANRIVLKFDDSVENKATKSIESSVGTLSVVTFNIAHGRGDAPGNWSEGAKPKFERIQKIATEIREIGADLVVLNEVDFNSTWSGHQNQAAAIAEAAGYPYRVEQRNLDFRFIYGSFCFGNAILSRYPITDAQVIDFPPEKNWEDWLVGCKRGVVASVRLNQSQRIRVAAIHLEHRSEKTRVAGAKEILQLIDPSGKNSLVVAGDFNSTPVEFPRSSISDDGHNAMDDLFSSDEFHYQPSDSPKSKEFTFSTMNPATVIDWILVSKTSELDGQSPFLRYEVLDTDLSDHRAVVAEIELTKGKSPSTPPLSQ